jgi:hypothetical protein
MSAPPITNLPLPEDRLRLLVAALGAEPGLVPIWNWRLNGSGELVSPVRRHGFRPAHVAAAGQIDGTPSSSAPAARQ